jgi:apolipoprotein N-acyltransferase
MRFSAPHPVLLALLAGFANGYAFVFGGEAALLANVPLLLALRDPRAVRSAVHSALLGGLVGFLGGVHIYGILDYGWFLFWGFSFYTASQMVLYALLFRHLWGRLGSAVDVLLPAAIWTLTEWLRTIGPLCMPASYAGCIADVPALRPLLALAPYTGGLGVSFIVALVQSVVFHALFVGRSHRTATVAGGGVAAWALTLGLWAPPALGDAPVRVAGVQGGLPNTAYAAARADPAASRDVVRTYETLSTAAYRSGAELVVWPETAVRLPVTEVPNLAARLFPPATATGVTLIAGLPRRVAEGDERNAALVVAPGGRVTDVYDKVRLVPGHEALYTPGPEWRPVDTPVGPVGVLICLESVYPEIGRAMTLGGAELLVVISNDAGFGRSPIAHHMTNRAIVQAVENGRWLLRVGQAGISTLIDPTGRTTGTLGLFEHGLVEGTAHRRSDRTLYTRFGDWFMGLVALGLGAALMAARRTPSAPRTRAGSHPVEPTQGA